MEILQPFSANFSHIRAPRPLETTNKLALKLPIVLIEILTVTQPSLGHFFLAASKACLQNFCRLDLTKREEVVGISVIYDITDLLKKTATE